MKNQRIAIVGTVGLPAKYGGFETLTDHLVKHLATKTQMTVYCSRPHYKKKERVKEYNGARLVYMPFRANGFQSIIYDVLSIFHACFFADVILVLGVSGGLVLPFVKLFTKKKIIVNIDGLEWRREKWNWFARKFLKFSEYLCVKFSHSEITDNEVIKKYTAKVYNSVSRKITYGGDHVLNRRGDVSLYMKFPELPQRYAFKVCRVEPENNVHLVLEAFTVKTAIPLVIMGNWQVNEYAKMLFSKYHKNPNIYLLEPNYNQSELDLIRSNATIYIHGHSAGGTNPSLVEAMNLGLPIFAFDVGFNKYSTVHKALYFKDMKSLRLLVENTALEQLNNLSVDMKNIAKTHYQWSIISQQYLNLFNSVVFNVQKEKIWFLSDRLTRKEIADLKLNHIQNSRIQNLIV